MQFYLFNAFKRIKKAYKNYMSVIFFLIIRKKNIKVTLRLNGKSYIWSNLNVRNYINAVNINYEIGSDIKFFPENDLMEFNYFGRKFKFYGFLENGWTYKELHEFEYKDLNFKDEIVIDIGANTGATSIYFALNGAKKVYAIEPMPKTYSILVKNIEINGLEEKCIPLNIGIGKRSILKVNPDTSGLGATIEKASKIPKNLVPKTVEIKNLSDLINDLNLKSCVIKLDCEGCEYDALLDLNNETFSHIKEIILEYHHGNKNLIRYLNDMGYNVIFKSYGYRVGILYAKRNRV